MVGLRKRDSFALFLATATYVAAIAGVDANTPGFSVNSRRASFVSRIQSNNNNFVLELSRGGGDVGVDEDDSEVDEEEEEEYDDEDEEEEEEEEQVARLSKSTLSAVKKSEKKAASKSKATVNASLKKTKKPSKSIAQILHVPYIVRACLNPFTVLAMTKAYFASLFNVNYLQKESSQGLRSALEAKAKKEAAAVGGRKKPKGKKTMRPGQAKSLSDLPALSA